jgi:hypothetical protein
MSSDTTREPKEKRPIFASALHDALRYALDTCPKPSDDANLSFVAIIPQEDRRILVTARDGRTWVGSYVDGEGLFRIALTYESAKVALGWLAAACKNGDGIQTVVAHPTSRKTWLIASDETLDPVVVRLHEHYPRWDVNSRVAPPLFPTGWEAPNVAVRDAITATPKTYPSDVFMLGRRWRNTQARWWIDPQSGRCKVEFTQGERVLAFAVVTPWGEPAQEHVVDSRQRQIPGTEKRDAATPPPTDGIATDGTATAHTSPEDQTPSGAFCDEKGCGWKGAMADLRVEAGGVTHCPSCGSTAIIEHANLDAGDAAASGEIVDAPIPAELSPALLTAIRLAHAFRIATERQEIAAWTGKRRDEADAEKGTASLAFWSAFEALDENDRSLCAQIAGDAEQLAKVLEAHPEKGKGKRSKKSDGDQQSIAGSEG